MKFRRTLLLSFTIMLGLASLHAPSNAQQRLRVAGNFPNDHTASKMMEIFKKDVEAKTNGELQIDLFPNMQLGGASENVDQVRSGTVFAVVTSIAYFTRIVPEFEAVSLPFLFSNRDTALRVMDGPVGQQFDALLAKKGFIGLGYGELGFRNITNNVRPITSVEDIKGLKIRLQPNEVHMQTFRALGANPVAMDIKEVYSAMQQGVLDGHENPYNIIASRRFNEVQIYLSDSGHFYDFIMAAANKRLFEKLTKPQQAAVLDSMKSAMAWQRAEAAKIDDGWKQKLIDSGMKFTAISPEARTQFRNSTSGVVDGLKQRIDPALVEVVIIESTK